MALPSIFASVADESVCLQQSSSRSQLSDGRIDASSAVQYCQEALDRASGIGTSSNLKSRSSMLQARASALELTVKRVGAQLVPYDWAHVAVHSMGLSALPLASVKSKLWPSASGSATLAHNLRARLQGLSKMDPVDPCSITFRRCLSRTEWAAAKLVLRADSRDFARAKAICRHELPDDPPSPPMLPSAASRGSGATIFSDWQSEVQAWATDHAQIRGAASRISRIDRSLLMPGEAVAKSRASWSSHQEADEYATVLLHLTARGLGLVTGTACGLCSSIAADAAAAATSARRAVVSSALTGFGETAAISGSGFEAGGSGPASQARQEAATEAGRRAELSLVRDSDASIRLRIACEMFLVRCPGAAEILGGHLLRGMAAPLGGPRSPVEGASSAGGGTDSDYDARWVADELTAWQRAVHTERSSSAASEAGKSSPLLSLTGASLCTLPAYESAVALVASKARRAAVKDAAEAALAEEDEETRGMSRGSGRSLGKRGVSKLAGAVQRAAAQMSLRVSTRYAGVAPMVGVDLMASDLASSEQDRGEILEREDDPLDASGRRVGGLLGRADLARARTTMHDSGRYGDLDDGIADDMMDGEDLLDLFGGLIGFGRSSRRGNLQGIAGSLEQIAQQWIAQRQPAAMDHVTSALLEATESHFDSVLRSTGAPAGRTVVSTAQPATAAFAFDASRGAPSACAAAMQALTECAQHEVELMNAALGVFRHASTDPLAASYGSRILAGVCAGGVAAVCTDALQTSMRHRLVMLDNLDDLAAAASILRETQRSAESHMASVTAGNDIASNDLNGTAAPSVGSAVSYAVASAARALHADALGRLVFLFYTRRVDPLGDISAGDIAKALQSSSAPSASSSESEIESGQVPGAVNGVVSTNELRAIYEDIRQYSEESPGTRIGGAAGASRGVAQDQEAKGRSGKRTLQQKGRKNRSKFRFPWHPALQWGLQALASVYSAVPAGSFAGLAFDMCRAVELAIRRDAQQMHYVDRHGSVLLVVSHLLRMREQVGSMLAAGSGAVGISSSDARPGLSSSSISISRGAAAGGSSSGPTAASLDMTASYQALSHFVQELISAPGHLLRFNSTNPVLTLLKEGLPHVERKSEDAAELRVALEASLRRACAAWVATVVSQVQAAAAREASEGGDRISLALECAAGCADMLSLWLPEPSMQRVLLKAMVRALQLADLLGAGSVLADEDVARLEQGLASFDGAASDPRRTSFVEQWRKVEVQPPS